MALFELAKVFCLAKDDENGSKKPQIHQYCWKEVGEKNTLALYFSNDSLVLLSHLSSASQAPVCRQLPWFPKDPIQSMCFDPSASWLLCCNFSGSVYLVPVATIMNPGAEVAGDWSTEDVTKLHISAKKGCITCVVWWQTLTGQQIALVATKLGFVVVVSLEVGSVFMEADVGEHVVNMSLVTNDSQSQTYALITTKSHKQWKLLLEYQIDRHKPRNSGWEALDMGFEVVDTVKSVLDHSENSSSDSGFVPSCFHQFSSSVILSAQYAKGRHFVSAHNLKKSTYEVFESSLEHNALYAFRVPETVESVVFTDRFLFLSSICEASSCVLVMSNQLAEGTTGEYQGYDKKAVIHEFHLPPNERILFLAKKSFPFYWHADPLEDSLLSSHTVLDGCLILTSCALYVCRPRDSPERVFLQLACESVSGAHKAEALGIMVGLDVNELFRLAAEQSLRSNKCSMALTLFRLGKCPAVERVRLLLQNGMIQEATVCLHQLLDSQSPRVCEVTSSERNLLNSVALPCFLYELAATPPEGSTRSLLEDKFKNFLLCTFSFDKTEALELLIQFRLYDLLFQFALGRGLVLEAIQLLISPNKDLPLTQAHSGKTITNLTYLLVRLLMAIDLDEFIFQIPESFASLKNHFRRFVGEMSEETLLQCVEIFDPLHYLSSVDRSPRSALVTSSPDLNQTPDIQPVSHIVELFLMTIIQLNAKRKVKDASYALNILFKSENDKLLPKVAEQELVYRPNLLACGQHHVILVKDGQCFSWGKASSGALGRDHRLKESDNQILKIYGFPSLRTKVKSLSCGAHHCLALTTKGVYAWGGSELGQVGSGSRGTYTQPHKIGGFGDEEVAFVSCGMYHSLAVSKSCKAFSWGWGVFGQLGHGAPEDELRPRVIKSLRGIVKGTVFAFGCNSFGQLGMEGAAKLTKPVPMATLPFTVRTIATKHFHNLAVTVDGDVYSWGASPQYLRQSASRRRKKNLSTDAAYTLPSKIDTSAVVGTIDSVLCGMSMSGLLTKRGDLYAWGSNLDGQLGLGLSPSATSFEKPHLLRSFEDPLFAVAMGSSFVIAMDTESTLFGWGSTEYGQLASITLKGPRQRSTISLHSKEEHSIIASPKRIEIRNSGREISRQRQNSNRTFQLSPEWTLKEADVLKACQLTDLRGSDFCPYAPSVILSTVQLFPKHCDVKEIAKAGERSQSWMITAQLHQHMGHFSEAFHFFVKVLKEISLSRERLLPVLLDCLQKEIACVSDSVDTSDWKNDQRESLLSELVNYYTEMNALPSEELEGILRRFLSEMALSVHLVGRGQKIFTSEFLMDVTDILIGQMASQPQMAYEICKLGDLDLPVNFNLQENLSYQRKIDEMHGDACGPTVLMSNAEVRSSNALVIFSCGHHFPPEDFRENALPAFEASSKLKFPHLDLTLSAIVNAFRSLELGRVVPLACPQCILPSLSAQIQSVICDTFVMLGCLWYLQIGILKHKTSVLRSTFCMYTE
ncbi:hypothetical protein CAPTEDRAFT_226039 [Capitella teleta]|uniref:Uncharacterized protein n=1 Tax=Capitella teleta TaxID=283909 RepID=R7TUP1_CAPTE|nr:hypothetical protein CAPTEDRAFT_226039 [Capitella teleta]|eukprot:ELT94735.1 hypothetical protein CAPTEDRAFT_226039 [Capitella teleta]